MSAYGLTDRIDIGADIPFARISVSGANLFSVTFPGEEPFTRRGVGFNASSSGLSDILLRGKVLAVSRSEVDAAAIVHSDCQLATPTTCSVWVRCKRR